MDRMSRGSYWIKWRPEDSSLSRTEVMWKDRSLVNKSDPPKRTDFGYWDWKSEIKV